MQYRGVSLGLPQVVERLTWKKFMKVFVADDQQGWGFNVRLQQTALDEPCEPLTDKKGKPLRFGRYGLRPAQKGEFEDFESPPLVLDYGACEGRSFDPMRCLRDPLVALNPDDLSVLLGMTYLSLAGQRVATPSFFSLRRVGERSYNWSDESP